MDPAVGVGLFAALDADQSLAQFLGQLPGTAAADHEFPMPVGHFADRGDDGCGAAGKGFKQFAACRVKTSLWSPVPAQ